MPEFRTRACGVLLFREQPRRQFLLMVHADRLDIPKGHIDLGETDEQCALRELNEETGVPAEAVKLDRNFRYTTKYHVRYKRFNNREAEKTLVVFLGWLKRDPGEIMVTEHIGAEWRDWDPPHSIQPVAIDPLLKFAERYFEKRGE